MESDKRANQKALVQRYWKFVRPYRFVIVSIIVLGIMSFAVPLAIPWMTKILIDDVLPGNKGFWSLEKVILVMAGVFAFGVVINFIRNYITDRLGNQMALDMKQQLYEHLQKLSPQYYDNRQIGTIVSRVQNDVNGALNLVRGGVINLVIDLFMIIFAAILLFSLNWKLALLSLWILPLYYLTFANLNVRIRFAWGSVHKQMGRISGVLFERISGMKIVQSFNREPEEMSRFKKQIKHHYDYAMSAHVLSNVLGSITQTFNNTGNLISWFIGGMFVLNGHFTIGALIAFQQYLMQLYGPIQQFANINITIQNSMANIERIFEVFDIDPDIESKQNAIVLDESRGEIVFESVSFTYVIEREEQPKSRDKDGDPDVIEKFKPDKKFYWVSPRTAPPLPPVKVEETTALRDVSFVAKAGEVVAIVGPSGSGKSTMINLIPRFYDPNKGRILLDNVDLRDYDVTGVREQIALVLQDNILFSGTVFDNIAYAQPNATHEEVISAAKAAYAHEFIEAWPKGYETMLGERGVRLSGGQKQRIAIARALLKNPRILILDEATSALDADSEENVTAALEELMKNRTTFIIAHRLATVVRADQILVMDEGRIVEQGSHSELLKQDGLYRDLYEKQLKAMRPDGLFQQQSVQA
ncbi:ABC transporter ATP-binding protein [Sporosarcina sp. YIM B06819]|uniref:ABC transporter ATP-binding protein n=1 Tax=Sporosarcina sp. YIM B06819 TaxID=3081769 RepID=UPI00298C946F|nr:ABC transporter ATP-binding protein [Sporosarcina sp. YIM B06819]